MPQNRLKTGFDIPEKKKDWSKFVCFLVCLFGWLVFVVVVGFCLLLFLLLFFWGVVAFLLGQLLICCLEDKIRAGIKGQPATKGLNDSKLLGEVGVSNRSTSSWRWGISFPWIWSCFLQERNYLLKINIWIKKFVFPSPLPQNVVELQIQ